MDELLISFYVDGPHSAPVGQRIWCNGLAEAYRTSRRIKNAAGEFVTVKIPPDWYRITDLDTDQLSAVQAAIAEVDIAAIPVVVDTVSDSRTDTSFAVWHIRYENDTGTILKEIHVAQWGPLVPEIAPLMRLLLKVNTVINSRLATKS